MKNEYHTQADAFLSCFSVRCRITLSDTKAPNWQPAGHHYRVTLSRIGKPGRVTFDFWGSVADANANREPHAYDVLACISGDVNCPDTFAEWCAEYGDSADSIKALQTWRRCHAFAKRLNAFFTAQEIKALQEIR